LEEVLVLTNGLSFLSAILRFTAGHIVLLIGGGGGGGGGGGTEKDGGSTWEMRLGNRVGFSLFLAAGLSVGPCTDC